MPLPHAHLPLSTSTTQNPRPAGEEVELQVRFLPCAVGSATMFGVCEVEGAPVPTGFMLSTQVKGLEVTYDLLTQDQYDRWGEAGGGREVGKAV